jgi:hypothetical protein
MALGRAWLALCGALTLHVLDETLTGFLRVWNPTALAIRERLPWAILPVFRFDVWLGGLIFWVCLGIVVSPLFFRGGRRLRPLAWFLGVLMIGNGIGHILATIFGRTAATVRFPRPAPGFYSSPLLIAAAVWLLVELRRTRTFAP